MTSAGDTLSGFPGVHHKVEHTGEQDTVMTSSFMHTAGSIASGSMNDTPSSALVEPDPHSMLSSSLAVPQSSLTVTDEDSGEGTEESGDLNGGEFSQQLGGSGDESDPMDALTGLGFPQSSLFLVNLPTRTQAPLGTLGTATTTFMPVLVLGSNVQKGAGENNMPQLLKLRDLAHANLICATQESIARTYNTAPPKPAEKREFKCEECGRNFKSSSHYRYHMETHKGNKLLKCPVNGCNRSFSWPANLKYHLRTHANDRPYPCRIEGCGKTFFTVQALNVHTRIHTGTRPFKCSHDGCDKSFTTAGNLKNHVRTHTGERPFACDYDGCTQRFAEQSSLKKHKLTHTGEKPYECEICGRVFSQSASRNTHKRRHHGSLVDNKMSSLLDDERDEMTDTLTSKGRGSSRHHTASKSQFSIERLKEDLRGSHSIDDIDSSDIPSVAATCSVHDTDDMSLSHSLLQGLGHSDTQVPDCIVKSDSRGVSCSPASVLVLSQPQHSIHSMVSGSQQPQQQHRHHHQHPPSADSMVYGGPLLQSDLDQTASHVMGVSDDPSVGQELQYADDIWGGQEHLGVSVKLEPTLKGRHCIGVSSTSGA